jgi:hypothetical protein
LLWSGRARQWFERIAYGTGQQVSRFAVNWNWNEHAATSPMRDLIRVTTLSWVIATATPGLAGTPPMGEDEARLLLARTAFAATADDVRTFSGLTREQAVDRLLAGARTTAMTPAPAWTSEFTSFRQLRQLPEEEKKAFLQREIVKRDAAHPLAAARGVQGPGDDCLSRQRLQPERPAQRELRA